MRRSFLTLLLAVSACGAPEVIDDTNVVNTYIAKQDYAAACAGLKSKAEAVREHTTKMLALHTDNSDASTCICAALHPAEGHWDTVVARTLALSESTAIGTCMGEALLDKNTLDREALADALGKLRSTAAFDALATIAERTSAPESIRVAAIKALALSPSHIGLLRALVADSASSSAARAAAIMALANDTSKATTDALVAALSADTEAEVRTAAAKALGRRLDGAGGEAVCKALNSDADPFVRLAAAEALDGTKSAHLARCLAERLSQGDDSASVREAVLDGLKHSPTDAAAQALCSQIGPFVRRYVKDRPIEYLQGVDIIDAQNFRDYSTTETCVNAAVRQSGYSCYARYYLAQWVNDLGGKARLPRCPTPEGKVEDK